MFGHVPAYIALILFPVFTFFVFSRLERVTAVCVCVLAGSLFLPESVAIDFPVVPPIDKEYMTYLSTLMAVFVFHRGHLLRGRLFAGIGFVLFLMFLANLGTMLMNPLPLFDEGVLEEALGFYWLLANTVDDLLLILMPFLIGRAMFSSFDDLAVLFRLIVVAGAIYFVLIVIEVALSAVFYVWQFSRVIYGVPVLPSWRWGVIQPVVFMENSLSLASFMALAAVASATYIRSKLGKAFGAGRLAQFSVFSGLLMTRNIAGNIYGFSLAILIWLFRPVFVARISLLIMIFVFSYPMLRIMDLFPYQEVVALAASIEPERARSFEGRFLEEDFVLSQIGDRLLVGWGNISRTPGAETFGRGEVGLDGFWTIRLGARGILGVLLYSMLFAYPILIAWKSVKRIGNAHSYNMLLAALMAMVVFRMADLLINGWWNCLPMFLAGALLGVARSQLEADVPDMRHAAAPAMTR